MKFLLFLIGFFIIKFDYLAFSQNNHSLPNQIIELENVGNGIFTIKSCFDLKFRKKTVNMSKLNAQWKYEEDPYFDQDGCYKIVSRKKPEEDEILNHLEQITFLPKSNFIFDYKNYKK